MDRLYNQNEVIIANESNKCSRSKYCEILCIEASKCEKRSILKINCFRFTNGFIGKKL